MTGEEDNNTILFTNLIRYFAQKKLDLNLYARWAALRFVYLFGSNVCDKSLQELADQIGIEHKKLRKILVELSNLEILKITFPEKGARSRVRHIVFNHELVCGASVKAKKHARLAFQSRPCFRFITEVLVRSDEILVSNKQKNNQSFQEMIANDFMVLICLLYYSDRCGIVMLCGTPDIIKFTGLSKVNIYKSKAKLKKYGFIRSHVHGTINNTILDSSAPVYCLNLSHHFFGEKAIYGNFYITQFKADHILEFKDAYNQFNFVRTFDLNLETESSFAEHDLISSIEPCYLDLARGGFKNYGLTKFYIDSTKTNQKKSNILSSAYGLEANIYFLQTVFEQWASRIFSRQAYQLAVGKIVPNFYVTETHLTSECSLPNFVYTELLMKEGRSMRYKSARLNGIELHELNEFDRAQLFFFFLKIIEKISQSHLFFYSWFKFHQYKNISLTRENYHVDAFRILPRTGDWAHTSCVFEIDHKAVENKFFLMKPENREEVPLDNFKFYSEIKPTLDQLRHFGLLDKTCLAIDAFPSAL